jgi:hypothetical protein
VSTQGEAARRIGLVRTRLTRASYAECRPKSRVHRVSRLFVAALSSNFQNLKIVIHSENEVLISSNLDAKHAIVEQKVHNPFTCVALDAASSRIVASWDIVKVSGASIKW